MWTTFISFIKAFPAAVKLIDSFWEAWKKHKVKEINVNYEEREEEREAIIWAMEEARKIRDVTKLRALNRQLAALDGGGVMPT